MSIENKQVTVETSNAQKNNAEATIQKYSEAEAHKRAVRGVGIFFALAVGSIFLPLVHFVLVPMFLILTPVAFVFLKRTKAKILKIAGTCPACGHAFLITDQPNVWPQESICDKCRKTFKVTQDL